MSEASNIQRPVQNFPDYLKYVAKKSKAGFDKVHEELLRLYYDSFDKSDNLKKAAVLEKPGGSNLFSEGGCQSKTEPSDAMYRNAKTMKEVTQPSFISYITEEDEKLSDCFSKKMKENGTGDKPALGNTLHGKLSDFDKMRCSMPYCELTNPVIYANDRVLLEEKINNSKIQKKEDDSFYAIPRTYLKKEKAAKVGEYVNLFTCQQQQPENSSNFISHQNQTEKHEHMRSQQKQPEMLNKPYPLQHRHKEKSDKLHLSKQGYQKKSNTLLSPQHVLSEKPNERSLTLQGHPEQSAKLHAPQRHDSDETDDYVPMDNAVPNDYDKPVSWKSNEVAKGSKVVASNDDSMHTILEVEETDAEGKSDDDFQDPKDWFQVVPKNSMREHLDAAANIKNRSYPDQNHTNYVPSSRNKLVPENENSYLNLNQFTDVSHSLSSNANKLFWKSQSTNATKSTAKILDSTTKAEQKILLSERQSTKDLYAKVIKKNDFEANIRGENCVPTTRYTVAVDDYCIPNSKPILVGIDNCIPTSRSVADEGDYLVPNSRPVLVSNYSVPVSRPAIVGSDFRVPDISGDITADHYCVPNSRPIKAENKYCVPSSIPLDIESDYSVPSSLPVTVRNDFCVSKKMPNSNNIYQKLNENGESSRQKENAFAKLADTYVIEEILTEDLYAKVDKKGYRLPTNDDYCVPRSTPVVRRKPEQTIKIEND